MAYRVEYDLLGEREIPGDAYWGIHTLRALENFQISSQKVADMPHFVRSLVLVKKAAAQANGELGALPPEVASAIDKACDEILVNGRCMDQFPTDVFQGGAGTSVNMNACEVIANLALEQLGQEKGNYEVVNPIDDVNASQSTNDVYPTAFRLAVYYSVGDFLKNLTVLKDSFAQKADEFKDVLKLARTQLQDAVPMTLGQEFKSFQVLLDEEIVNLERTRQLLLEVNLGATAIGTGVNTPEGYADLAVKKLAEVSGLDVKLTENLIEATSDCGAYVMVHSAVKRTAVKVSKICNDLRLLSSGPRAGFGEINLPEMQAGSSITPAKVNPVIPEMVSQVCFKVLGNDTTITFASEAGQLQLNVMEPVIAQCMLESVSLLNNACAGLAEKCIQGITANREVCESYVFNSIGLITFLNPYIGHENGDYIGKICLATGKSVRDVILDLGLMEEKDLDRILSRENMLNAQLNK
ncbi:aspartate ammonia-lyase [Neisseria sp. CCUG12390]|uniref:aspartate ammonia-lyase n=1 Tax=Neisseria sp. CCUG12390 TaxID=3392035 RepID=UPI003A102826